MRVKIFDNYTVRKNHIGKAIFAARSYKKGDAIVMFEGPILRKKDLPKKISGRSDRYVQISPTKYLGPSHTIDDFINHSCDPNAGLKFTDFGIMLIAIKPIRKEEEITWDYSTTMYRDPWTMKCDCGSKKCRKLVREFKFLPKTIKTKYFKLGILPPYLVKMVYN